ncbi:MAG TPA: hypothetical protein VN643_23145 [Pyrinomonadaceae bacterium]|nr:hypothetical protein [Pyrinomonadaceae bacterium]
MGRITAKIKLNQFYIRKQNDQGGKDEPYLLTLFAGIDGNIADPKVPLGENILLVCRASDLLYWRAESGDGG